MSYITNGRVAWDMPSKIGAMYECGAYLTPAGWSIITRLPPNARLGACCEWQLPQGAAALEGTDILREAQLIRKKKRVQSPLDQALEVARKYEQR